MNNNTEKHQMDRRKTVISIITIILSIAAILLLFFVESYMSKLPTMDYSDEDIAGLSYFEVFLPRLENEELLSDITGYSFGDGYIHVVIPGSVQGTEFVFYVRDESGNLLCRRECDFTDKVMLAGYEVILDKSNIPIMYFNSDDSSDYTKMLKDDTKTRKCDGEVRIGSVTDSETDSRKIEVIEASLKGRGSSSWGCDVKKSFTLTASKKANLLGLGEQKKWNLVGNAYDQSLLKNYVFNDLAREVGISMQPKMEYVNLFADGVYQGVYTVTTKVDRSEEMKRDDFLFVFDPPNCDQPIYYESESWFEDGGVEPVADLIYPDGAKSGQMEKAYEYVQRFIDCIEDTDDDDIWEHIDLDSLVKYYWVQEAAMNFDAWQRSTYCYYSVEDEKMHMGPLWDTDLSLGSPYEKQGMKFDSPNRWYIRNAGWYTFLFEREDFREAVREAYFDDGVKEALADSLAEFSNVRERLGEDAYRNFLFYGHSNQGYTVMYGDTYDEYCDNMISFYADRLKWIDEEMNKESE